MFKAESKLESSYCEPSTYFLGLPFIEIGGEKNDFLLFHKWK